MHSRLPAAWETSGDADGLGRAAVVPDGCLPPERKQVLEGLKRCSPGGPLSGEGIQ